LICLFRGVARFLFALQQLLAFVFSSELLDRGPRAFSNRL